MELQKPKSSLTRTQDNDYEIVIRSSETSPKYCFSLMGKEIHTLNSNESPLSLKNMPIVCSYADMEFKISPLIQNDFIQRLSLDQLHLGYTFLPKARQAIVDKVNKNTGFQCKKQEILLITSMQTLYHLVITQLTQKDDQVLIFTPTYYRLLFTLQKEERRTVEYELKKRQDTNGQTQFYIDFQELSKIFALNQIKMMVFVNPHNPTGKIWSREDIIELKNLCLKYQCLIFSDDIFCDCIPEPKSKYTSFLSFPELHSNLIWAGSFGKAFNCSGNSFTYAIIENSQIRAKIDQQIMKLNLYPTYAAGKLLESCYSVGQKWRLSTINYIDDNYVLLKEEIKKRGMKINAYKLGCTFVPILDFAEYKWPHREIKKRLESQNIFPTFLESCYLERSKESISCGRFNIAMNRDILNQLIDRMQKALKN